MIVIVTFVPFGPRIRLTLSMRVIFLVSLPIDLKDLISCQDTRFKSRRILDRRDDGENTVFGRDLDPQTFKASLRLCLHLLKDLRRHESGVRVQGLQHSLDRPINEILRIRLLDIFLLNEAEDIGEDLQILIRAARKGGDLMGLAQADRDPREERPISSVR